jgi:hypothetical protein
MQIATTPFLLQVDKTEEIGWIIYRISCGTIAANSHTRRVDSIGADYH